MLIVDIVESVRLIEQDEKGTISRWLGLVDHIESQILEPREGRLVKSLGDGLLVEFDDVRSAVSAAFEIQEASARANAGLDPNRQILLRIGIEASNIMVEERDVFGHGVNLAARLAALAGPGQIVVSAQAREALTPDLDADVEDLGDCFLRHVQQPVRAYRLGRPGDRPVIKPAIPLGDLLPTVAVIPFTGHYVAAEYLVLGEILAEEVIGALSRSPEVNVISRLSTTAFRERVITLDEIRTHLNTNYVLSGRYRIGEGKVIINVELADAKSGQVVWANRMTDQLAGLLAGDQDLIGEIVRDVGAAVMSRELQRAQSQALPTLKSYTLLMAAIALMHRLSLHDFEEAHKLLEALIERASRQSVPHAWLAKWHVLRVQQGWSDDPEKDGQKALECTKRALDVDPDSSLALAIDGLVHTHLMKRHDVAQDRYDLAIEKNPNDSLAWLLKGTQHAFMGEGDEAVEFTQRALKLSPLDPHRYFYDSLAATACLAARQYEDALALARRSLRANRTHTSTLRAVAVAQWQLDHKDSARETAQELLRLEPDLTVSGWLSRSPSAPYPIGEEWASILRQIGLPA